MDYDCMKMDIKLEKEYSGDEIWYQFAETAKKEVNSSDFNADYDILNKLKECLKPHEDIAYVAYYFFYNDSIKWIERAIPILGNISPIECLSSRELTNRLREALLRTPL